MTAGGAEAAGAPATLHAVKNTRRVYSTEAGPRRPPDPAREGRAERRDAAPADGVVRVHRERAGRHGKTVTIVRGLPARDLDPRAAELRRLCAAGGAVVDGAVEIQGDHRERVAGRLRALGYAVKLAGG